MNKEQYFNQHRLQQIERQEMERKWRVFNEQRMFMNMALSNSASSGGGGAGGPTVELTPFILQAWAIGASGSSSEDWTLHRLYSDGTLVPVENAPPLEGPTVFAKNTIFGFHYFVTYNLTTEIANFGRWDSITGEWIFLEEGTPLLRNLVPASLQYIEGNEYGGNYFIYTDNSQILDFLDTSDIAPKTYRIDFPVPEEIELTELHEWETPEMAGYYPASTFYQLPVAVGASPSQGLFQVQQYGFIDSFPLAILSSINGDTYESTGIDVMSMDGLPIEAAKVAFILDRTDYEGVTYFNALIYDKINNTEVLSIAKFDPTSEDPANLTSIYQYNWEDRPYLTLTTI